MSAVASLAPAMDTAPMATVAQLQALLPGSTLVGDPACRVHRVHSDTRSLQAGDFFVALRGERFDAHTFLPQAKAAGAAAVMAERGLVEAGIAGLQVGDTRAALLQLGAAWRQQHRLQALIAVTGSNGKTTVTQMIAAVLRAHVGDAALATQGNLNNDVGVPLMALRLRPHHRLAVLELGMNHPGEIAQLAAVAQPTVALVNNAQREHQEFMHTVQAVAQENAGTLAVLPPDGTAVFPLDDEHTTLWRRLARERAVLGFARQVGRSGGAPVWAEQARWDVERAAWALRLCTPHGAIDVALCMPGLHNVANALACTAATLAAGVPLAAVQQGLQAFEAVGGRSRVLRVRFQGEGRTLIDDTYNANPDSARAAIDVLTTLPGPSALVLGDMGEVGDQGPAFHAEVGAYAREQGVARLITLGNASSHAADAFGTGAQHHAQWEQLQPDLGDLLRTHRSVLVKGSRFMKTERVVQALQAMCDDDGGRPACL
jgi:UDP-N-acetylmuramoyl-tripeptide--D-alanyl-D-alanine ligase